MAGQWVVPGGGVIPTLVSGKHAAMLLCRRDGKVFHTSSKNSSLGPHRHGAFLSSFTAQGRRSDLIKIFAIIDRSKKGIDIVALMKKTGFGQKRVRNIFYGTYK
jgi:hypothetical protein